MDLNVGAGEPVPAAGEDESYALALVNTRRPRSGTPADLIATPAAAADWLIQRGLLPPDARLTLAQAAALAALRESIHALFEARASNSTPAPGHLATINAALAAAPLIPALIWDNNAPRRSERTASSDSPADSAFSRLAADAITVLTSPGGAQPAPCKAHGCIRWFLRTHAARQWCSTRCGDRVRAARHYARHHAG